MVVPVNAGESLPRAPYAYNADLEHLEIELLLEGVYRHYGFDFRSYAYSPHLRRLWKRVYGEGLRTISALPPGLRPHPAPLDREGGGAESRRATRGCGTGVLCPVGAPFDERGEDGSNEAMDWTAQIAPSYFNNRKVSIYGGSNEIQRNIITKAVLGL